ncbi:MAG: hypothetical protein IJZ93_06750 [Clostridia bacterium]|nr:hypothetical protein [Clostridia bacterium]
MADMTIDAFKSTLDTLISSNPHARNKGDDFKEWCNCPSFSHERKA